MSTEGSRALVVQMFERFTAGDVDAVLALLHDDMTWRLAGTPALTPFARDYDKPRLRRFLQGMLSQLEGGLKMRVVSTIAEGDRVAAEVVSEGALKNGRVYRQAYHFAITFRDGKVAEVHEYFDTHHAWDVWVKP